MMSTNTWVISLLQICVFIISTRQSMARELAGNQFQANRNPIRFQSHTTIPQWNTQSWTNPATWRNLMVSLWNIRPGHIGSSFPSSINENNQEFRASSGKITGFSGFGKLRILNTLFNGLKNTGLEETIAGEVIQRLMKTLLKEILVPVKKEILT